MRHGDSEAPVLGKRRIALWLVFGLAVALLHAGSPCAQETPPAGPTTLAVVNFVNRNPGDGWDWLGTGLADMLITDLSKSASLSVVERERMAWMLKEMETARRGIVDPAAAQNIGHICKVDWALFGSFAREGDQISIEAHIVEVETGALLRVEWVQGKVEDFFALEKELVQGILSRLGVPLSEEERESLKHLATDSLDALTHYSLGLEAYESGEYEQAIAEYRLAVRKDPVYHQARVHLGDMYFRCGEPEHAVVEYREVLRKDTEGRLSEDAYFHMGRVLDRGLGRYREAIGCYQRILEKHSEYKYDQADVETQMILRSKAWQESRREDEAVRERARTTLDAISAHRQEMENKTRVSNPAIEQMVRCYEEMGDRLNAAKYAIMLRNFNRLHDLNGIGDAVTDELYQFTLRENLDDQVPMPAGMIRVPEGGLTIESDNLSEAERLALSGRPDPDSPWYVAPHGMELRVVQVTLKTPPDDDPVPHCSFLFVEYDPRDHKWVWMPEYPLPTTDWTTSTNEPVGVRGVRFSIHAKHWRVQLIPGPYRYEEAKARVNRSWFQFLAVPESLKAAYIDGSPTRVVGNCIGGGYWFPSGEYNARLVWSDGTERRIPFALRPGERKDLDAVKDDPFVRSALPIAPMGRNPWLLFDRDEKLWLYWDQTDSARESDIYFSLSDDGGRTWSEPRLSPVSGLGLEWRPVLQQDRYGTYWLLWLSSRDMSDPTALWMSCSADGCRWRHPWKVTLPQEQGLRENFTFAISVRNDFYIAFGGQLWHSLDGRTWSEPVSLTARIPGFPEGRCCLNASAGGLTLVGTRGNDAVLTTSRDGETWSKPTSVPGPASQVVLAKDADGNSVLLSYTGSGLTCRLRRSGSEFGGLVPIATERSKPFDPTVACSGSGRWAVAYGTKDRIIVATATNPFGERKRLSSAGASSGQQQPGLHEQGLGADNARRRMTIEGVERVSNMNTGAATDRPSEDGVIIAPGDCLEIAVELYGSKHDRVWYYVWTGAEEPSVTFSEGAGLQIKGARGLITNLTTGGSTHDQATQSISVAPGDRLAVTLGDGSSSEVVWKGGRFWPPPLWELDRTYQKLSVVQELLLGEGPTARVVSVRGYWGPASRSEYPSSWSRYNSLVSLDLGNSDVGDGELSAFAVLGNLRHLNVSYSGVSDLSPLSALHELRVLDLDYCRLVADLSPLSGLESLRELDLFGCKGVTDLSPLSALPNLERLRVEVKDADGLAAVSRIKSLTHLDLTCTGDIADLSPLSNLSNLKSLHLTDFDGVTDLAPLSDLEGLASLHLIDCDKIANLSPLSDLGSLRSLHLWRSSVSNLSPLAGLTGLTHLDLWYCEGITDLSPLSNHENLTSLVVSQCDNVHELKQMSKLRGLSELVIGPGCMISADEIKAFLKMNPACELSY